MHILLSITMAINLSIHSMITGENMSEAKCIDYL